MSYYGLPLLKRPLWGWEIALYFFSEGISSGTFVLATLADVCGDGRYDRLIRKARFISLATLAPSPGLLIHDLGRPDRFLFMLRIFRASSPMSMGAWALTGFSLPVALLALAEFTGWRWLPARAIGVAGLPLALFMLAYPGVLLSTTSIPVWSGTRFLGPLLGAGSLASAASALTVAAALDPRRDDGARRVIHTIEAAAKTGEAIAMAAYVASAGPAAAPLTRGRYAPMFRFGAIAAGVAAPALILATRRKPSRVASVVSGVFSLVGALALKWAVVHAGKDSAEASRP